MATEILTWQVIDGELVKIDKGFKSVRRIQD